MCEQCSCVPEGALEVTTAEGADHIADASKMVELESIDNLHLAVESLPPAGCEEFDGNRLRPHLMDLYAALGVEWGKNPFLAIDLLKTGCIDADRHQDDYERACKTIARMHEAAVGEIRGPDVGVVEDVAEIRARMLAAESLVEEIRADVERFLGELHPVLNPWIPFSVEPLTNANRAIMGMHEHASTLAASLNALKEKIAKPGGAS
jgi:hypothetical protein